MARPKKVVGEKDYDTLIKTVTEEIAALEQVILENKAQRKEKKAELKRLEKDKARYEEMIAEQKKQEEVKKAAEMILASGKSLEELQEFLSDH